MLFSFTNFFHCTSSDVLPDSWLNETGSQWQSIISFILRNKMSVLPFQLKDGLTMITGEKIKLLTRKGYIDHLNF